MGNPALLIVLVDLVVLVIALLVVEKGLEERRRHIT
jgi:hypothetical protein